MKSKTCAYCGQQRKLTKEHVYPKFINSLISTKMLSFINGVDKAFLGDPEIKDVCKHCNNIILSNLDAYAKTLTENYFIHTITNKVNFTYNYNSLLRWLLKVIYNGSRAFKSSYSELIPYIAFILNEKSSYPFTLLFISVMKSSTYDGQNVEPRSIGITDVFIRDEDGRYDNVVLTKGFYFYSYIFFLIGFNEHPDTNSIQDIIAFMQRQWGAELLDHNSVEKEIKSENSKIDYLSHLHFQNLNNPKIVDDNYKKKILNLREFFIQDGGNYKYLRRSTQHYIITYNINDTLIPVLVFEKDKIHNSLILNECISSDLNKIAEFLNAGVKIRRKNLKTYIHILDFMDLLSPYLFPISGVFQKQENWNNWKNAIENNNNYVFIGIVEKNLDFEKATLVSKIKVVELKEN